jgi:hypothetical protein
MPERIEEIVSFWKKEVGSEVIIPVAPYIYCDIIKPVTPDQLKDWTIRKGDRAVKDNRYKDAAKHYLEVLEKETENLEIREILLQKIAELDKLIAKEN